MRKKSFNYKETKVDKHRASLNIVQLLNVLKLADTDADGC